MGRKLEAGRKDGCRRARSTAGRWYGQPVCTELITSKKSKTGCGMTVPGFGSSDVGQSYGHVVAAEEAQQCSQQTLTSSVSTPLPCPLYPGIGLSDPFLFPVCPPRVRRAATSPKAPLSRDVIAVQIMPRGSKNRRRGRLFSDQINGTLKCLLKRSKSMGGRRERGLGGIPLAPLRYS